MTEGGPFTGGTEMAKNWFVRCGMLTALLAVALFVTATAEAQRGRGNSQALKQMQQQQQQMMAYQAEYQKEMAKKDAEILAKYDLNKNGKIDPNERAAFEKYLRDVKSGKEPDPYASIKVDMTKVSGANNKKAAGT